MSKFCAPNKNSPEETLSINQEVHHLGIIIMSEHKRIHAKYLRTIGKGSFGNVSLVVIPNYKDPVVLKVVTPEKGKEQQAKDEIVLMKKLSHPNVVKYIQSGMKNGRIAIFMEYGDNGDLAHYLSLQTEHFKEPRIWEIFLQVVKGLNYIHHSNILHRDLKPQNIFLFSSGVIKIGDLGVGKQLESNENFATTFTGTPYYLSPEICRGERYGIKSDMWSLGCILYEICTFNKPFNGINICDVISNILKGRFRPFDGLAYSCYIVGIIVHLLQLDQTMRMSCDEIMTTYDQYIKNDGKYDPTVFERFTTKK